MRYLLDTHILLWAVSDPQKLSQQHKEILQDNNNFIAVSQFSYLEITIKLKLNKLPHFEVSITEFINKVEEAGFVSLQIQTAHLERYNKLILRDEHRDPFDRFIIATAVEEKMKLLSLDSKFQLYKEFVEVI
ncbi:MAG TPA: type II toxin-antitoxin system VapC family toxin [Flavipsychrobacter sp.]|nr:type II toxin-antitoxin system VapC family toxin [Flavipsychrobacter sp.]